MGKLIIERSKADYLHYLKENLQPRKLRILRKWDYWTGNFDPKKEFEGSIYQDSYLIRENHKMLRRLSPVLKARLNKLGEERTEIDYRFSVDIEVIISELFYLLWIGWVLYLTDMPVVAYVILLPLILIAQIFCIWIGFATSKRKYLDFVSLNNIS